MLKTRKEIVEDLLREANLYWYDNHQDSINPINPDEFDPVVDKIFKANAVELEKLYTEIEESQREITLALAQMLVPDQSMLPEPGYTVAQIKPSASRVYTSPEDRFQISGQSETGEEHEYYFSSLYEHDYPVCNLCALISDHMVVQVEDGELKLVAETPGAKSTSTVWLGLDIGSIREEDEISFFLGNRIVDEFDKESNVFHTARWFLNGQPDQKLRVSRGISGFTTTGKKDKKRHLLDAVDVPNSYEKQIISRFRNSFIHLALPKDLDNFKHEIPSALSESPLVSEIDIPHPLIWIKMEFSLPIPHSFFLENQLYPNAIPLVNRRLLDNYVVKSNYDRILLPMRTTDYFLDVARIQDTRNEEDGTEYHRIDFLHPTSRPGTFIVRDGSRVRRLNRDDATQQINRLLEVIHDEYSTFKEEGVNRLKEDFAMIEKSMNRIRSQMPDLFRGEETKSSYFCIADFRPSVSRLHYTYWETQGESIRHLGDKTSLEVTSRDIKIANSKSLIPIQKGKGELTADDFVNQVKVSLLSRGRITTKGDIELYCQSRYGHLFEVANMSRKLMAIQNGDLTRGVLVEVKRKQPLSAGETEQIRLELQNDLNAKSAFFTPIKVEVYDGN